MGDYKAADLPIVIYLNQRIVFDTLATLEDGFTQVRELVSSTDSETGSESKATGGLGISNVFSLIGVNFGGSSEKKSVSSKGLQESTQKVHTPTSLFTRTRDSLKSHELLQELSDISQLNQGIVGEFVEFRVKLFRNPLLDNFEGLKQVMLFAQEFVGQSANRQQTTTISGGGKNRNRQHLPANSSTKSEWKQIIGQLDALISGIQSGDSLDIVGQLIDVERAHVVLSTNTSFFIDPTMNDFIDGQFRVVGKVTRVVEADSDASINLLRKTAFGRFPEEVTTQIMGAFNSLALQGFQASQVETEIRGPAFQVIPIAIFL
jgi:hypothetical protein